MDYGQIINGVVSSLSQLPDVSVHSVEAEAPVGEYYFDVAVVGDVKGRPVQLLVEIQAYAYPRDIQQAIWKFGEARQSDQAMPSVPLIAARSISISSRNLLREHHFAYWDSGGSLYLDLPWATYLVDRPVPSPGPRPVRRVYQGSAAQVLHALLLDPKKARHITELAARAQVSASTAHQVCRFLEQQLWLRKEGKGPRAVRLLENPGALLDAWAEAHSLAEYSSHRFHRWTRDPRELLDAVTGALDQDGVEYALTLGSGTQFVAPHATDRSSLAILVAGLDQLDDVARSAELRAVDEGETVTFYVTHDRSPLLFRRQVGGYWVASDVQLYLDLYAWPRRGKEQAEHLRHERLGY